MKIDPQDRIAAENVSSGRTISGKSGATEANGSKTAQSFGEALSSAAMSGSGPDPSGRASETSGAPSAAPAGRAVDSDGKLRELSKEFEAIFVNQMIKAMRKTIMKTGLITGGTGEEIFTEMLDMEYSKALSDNSSLGLATKIYEQLSGKPVDRETVDSAANLGRNINIPGKI